MITRCLAALLAVGIPTIPAFAQLPDEPGLPARPTIVRASEPIVPPDFQPASVQTETVYPNATIELFRPTEQFIATPGTVFDQPERGPLFWLNADYLMWFIRGAELPPLVLAAPSTMTGADTFDGRLSRQLYPNGSLNSGVFSGVKGTAGLWLDDSQAFGVDVSYFWLSPKSSNFSVTTDGGPAIGRPVVDASTGQLRFLQMNFPGLVSGNITAEYQTKMQGFESNLLLAGPDGYADRIDLIAGFRYLDFEERLRIGDIAAVPSLGLSLSSFDQFTVRNQFYGGQIGTRIRGSFGEKDRWISDFSLKLALGGMQSDVRVEGATRVQTLGLSQTFPGGVLATPQNLAGASHTKLVFMPEVNWNIGFRPSEHTLLYVGYNFMYMTQVLRPGGTIDTTIDTNNLPFIGSLPASGQASTLRSQFSDLWVQGITFGFALEY